MIGRLCLCLGLLLIFHAGYYTVQYSEYQKLAEENNICLQAIFEIAIGFIISLIGVGITAGTMQPIRSSDSICSRSFDKENARPEFDIFNHRFSIVQKQLNNLK